MTFRHELCWCHAEVVILQTKVPPTIKDYHDWVQPSDVIHLTKIEANLKRAAYSSSAAFRADFAQIHANSVRYNTPGHGINAFPGAVPPRAIA